MSQVDFPPELVRLILAYINPTLDRKTWLACCLVNSTFRNEAQPEGFKSIILDSTKQDSSERFLALLRSSEHIRHWVHVIDVAFYEGEGGLVPGFVEAELFQLLPSLETLILSTGSLAGPRSWYHIHHSLRETLCKHIFPRLEHFRLSRCVSFPATELLSAQRLRSLQVRDVQFSVDLSGLNDDYLPLPILELSLDQKALRQAVTPGNFLFQLKDLPHIRSLEFYFPLELHDFGNCTLLLKSVRQHLTRLQWGTISGGLWPLYKAHGLLQLSQYPVLEHLVLAAPGVYLRAFMPWLIAELFNNTVGSPALRSLTFICNFKTYNKKTDSSWKAVEQLLSLEHFSALVFTWVVLPAVSIFQDIAEELPLFQQRKLLRFNIPTQWEDDGEHIRAINQLLR
ncbi:hypothetical protein DL96DRAFT_1613341 [Flagelloscypha sp. PMI_526]|nr:hypothetical protein DL96DRAFT_1613341 [Flagelloscypha sp. PMI_526]